MIKQAVKPVFFGVLIWVLTSYPNPALAYQTNMDASVVIGQSDFVSNSSGTTANTLNTPGGIATNGTQLYIADSSNNRVLIYNNLPTSNNAPADIVVGQSNFTANSSNQGGSAAANTLSLPEGVFTDGTRLFIADYGNCRVLIYNKIPTTNNASADIVLGQSSLSTADCTTSVSATHFRAPTDVFYDQDTNKLVIVEEDPGNRVLIFNGIPASTGAAANVVVGQTDFNSNVRALTQSNLSAPKGAKIFTGKLLVSDDVNSRVLIWNAIPTSNGASADIVVGQKDFTSSIVSPADANTLWDPYDAVYDGKRLLVYDAGNNRVLIYMGIPVTNNASAYMVIGQTDFTSRSQNQGGSVGPNTLKLSGNYAKMFTLNDKLVLSDSNNNRILIYNNTIQNPNLSITNSTTTGANSKLRMNGRATVDSLYRVFQIMASVNGGDFKSVTPVDNNLDSAAENFYFDFDTGENNNKQDGYTLRIKAQNTNLDETDSLFFFSPFSALSPPDNEATTSALPTFKFSVNKQRIWMRDYLSKYQVQIAKNGTEAWKPYIDNIPVDYGSSKNRAENQQRLKFNYFETNNGVYETNLLTATYSEESSNVEVTPKDFKDLTFPDGRKLAARSYNWKVVAIDKVGHSQETATRTITIDPKPNEISTISKTLRTNMQKTGGEETIFESVPSASPTPTSSPKTAQQTSASSKELPKNKFCIWKLCLPKIDIWPF